MKIKTGLIIIFFLSLIAFEGCTSPQNDSRKESEALVLRSYEVPDRLSEQVKNTIANLLASRPGTGRASIAPDGQLLIAAPKSFHDGVWGFIEQLKNTNPEPSPSAEVNYWIVAGRKANKPAALEDFRMIKPALETIQNNQGNMEFKLLDHVTTTSSGQGTRTGINGEIVNIRQTLFAYSDGSLAITTDVKCGRSGSISTHIETKSGELVVLGKFSQEFSGIPIFRTIKDENEKKNHVELVNVYYIISATVKK